MSLQKKHMKTQWVFTIFNLHRFLIFDFQKSSKWKCHTSAAGMLTSVSFA